MEIKRDKKKEERLNISQTLASREALLPEELHYYSNESSFCQAHSLSLNSDLKEIDSKFMPKKEQSLFVASLYRHWYEGSLRQDIYRKWIAMEECGSFLHFAHDIQDGEISPDGKLCFANFCKDTFCPMCGWRRSLKIFGQVSAILDSLGNSFRYLFLTLTVRNVWGYELPKTVDRMMKAFSVFLRHLNVNPRAKKDEPYPYTIPVKKKAIKGAIRVLEITRNDDRHSSHYLSYHPHFHVILAVPPDYFSDAELYLTREFFLERWRYCYGDPEITQVDIRAIKNSSEIIDFSNFESVKASSLFKAVAEIAKYTVKYKKMFNPKYFKESFESLKVLRDSLYKRRLITFSGCFFEARKLLNLDDPEDGDLVHIETELNPTVSQLVFKYSWGAGVYKLDGVTRKSDQ